MSFYRRNWYYVGGILFVACAFFVGFWGNEIDPLRTILLLSFMALLMHQFEEYAIPVGFPAVFNIGWHHETEAPDRYPLNQQTCVCVNTFLAYPFYILPILFPGIVWLGLAQILFGLVACTGLSSIANCTLITIPGLRRRRSSSESAGYRSFAPRIAHVVQNWSTGLADRSWEGHGFSGAAQAE